MFDRECAEFGIALVANHRPHQTLVVPPDDAQQMFDDSFERGNAFGRLSEDIRPETGELWGNFAQAYSMVEIINTATRMSSSWEEEGWARV